MSNAHRYDRGDWTIATTIFLVGVALRVPFRSQMAYHWDSAQFTLAVREYNVALSQPHAPGYFLYVMLGRLLNLLVGDPHASLVWISVLFGSAIGAAVYLLGTTMFGRRTGTAAGLFSCTSPLIWFHSCVALTYVVDGFLVCLLVIVCWQALQRGGRWRDAVFIGVLTALIGGVRQQTVPALLPLILFTFWRFSQSRALKMTAAAAIALVLGIAWFVPMIRMSGGLSLYLEIVRRHAAFNAPTTLAGGGWGAFVRNLRWVGASSWNGLMLGGLLLVAGLLYRMIGMDAKRRREWNRERALALAVLALWLGPMLLLGTVVGFTRQPGYVLSYLPPLLILAGMVAAHLRGHLAYLVAVSAGCAINVVAFVGRPTPWDGLMLHVGCTARAIRNHDQQLAQTVRVIRSQFEPARTIICHKAEFYYFGLRHFQLYLPEFDQYQFDEDPTLVKPPGEPMLLVHAGRSEFTRGIDLAGTRSVLLVVPPGASVDIFRSDCDLEGVLAVPGTNGTVYELPRSVRERQPS